MTWQGKKYKTKDMWQIGGSPMASDMAWMGNIKQTLAVMSPKKVSLKAQFHRHRVYQRNQKQIGQNKDIDEIAG